MYKKTPDGVQRIADSAYIREDVRNQDWREYLGWRDAGNEALPEPEMALGKEEEVAALLARRGLTLENEWLLYGSIAGMLSAGAVSGKTEAQIYASNTGYRNAKNLASEIAAIRAKP